MEGGEGTPARDLFRPRAFDGRQSRFCLAWTGSHFSRSMGIRPTTCRANARHSDEVLKIRRRDAGANGISLPARVNGMRKKRQNKKDDVLDAVSGPSPRRQFFHRHCRANLSWHGDVSRELGHRPLTIEAKYPLWTFWDIGNGGSLSQCWLGQQVFRDILVSLSVHDRPKRGRHGCRRVDSANGEETGRSIAKHFFPHDVDYRDRAIQTYRQQRPDAGVPNHKIITVSIAGDKWTASMPMRDQLPRMWFDLA